MIAFLHDRKFLLMSYFYNVLSLFLLKFKNGTGFFVIYIKEKEKGKSYVKFTLGSYDFNCHCNSFISRNNGTGEYSFFRLSKRSNRALYFYVRCCRYVVWIYESCRKFRI